MAQPACGVSCIDRSDSYARRRPENSVLYQTVSKHWPAFRERLEEAGGVPRFVVREFEEYLRCGVLEEGCLHLVCRQCGHSQVVALSCKKRGFCPACLGHRMAVRAAGRAHPSLDLLTAVGFACVARLRPKVVCRDRQRVRRRAPSLAQVSGQACARAQERYRCAHGDCGLNSTNG